MKIKELLGTYLVYVCAEIISVYMLIKIYIGKYIHILLSLELLVLKKFYKILTNLIFYLHVKLVVINKVYLVTN